MLPQNHATNEAILTSFSSFLLKKYFETTGAIGCVEYLATGIKFHAAVALK